MPHSVTNCWGHEGSSAPARSVDELSRLIEMPPSRLLVHQNSEVHNDDDVAQLFEVTVTLKILGNSKKKERGIESRDAETVKLQFRQYTCFLGPIFQKLE